MPVRDLVGMPVHRVHPERRVGPAAQDREQVEARDAGRVEERADHSGRVRERVRALEADEQRPRQRRAGGRPTRAARRSISRSRSCVRRHPSWFGAAYISRYQRAVSRPIRQVSRRSRTSSARRESRGASWWSGRPISMRPAVEDPVVHVGLARLELRRAVPVVEHHRVDEHVGREGERLLEDVEQLREVGGAPPAVEDLPPPGLPLVQQALQHARRRCRAPSRPAPR